jgi:DNA-binding protein HU-beta
MSDKVTFSELVKSFAEAHDITQQKAETFIRGLFDTVLEDLENNGKASITNFGSFSIKKVAERTGVNPQTKEEIVIPAHNKVTFKPYKALENTVNAPFADLEPTLLGDAPEKEEPKAAAPPLEQPKETPPPVSEEKMEDDPFEEVISGSSSDEKEEEAVETQDEAPAQEEEKEETAPPVYKSPEKEESSVVTWLLIVLILSVIGTGAWYFFIRETAPSDQTMEMVIKMPEQTEQPTTPPVTEATPTDNNAAEQPETKQAPPASATEATASTSATTAVKKEMESYTIKKDEWMWDISRKVYGEPYLWPLIFEANKTVNDDPNLVEPASTLTVPSIDGTATSLTKSDFAKLAKASMLVSEAYGNAGNTERSAEYLRFAKKYERQSKE